MQSRNLLFVLTLCLLAFFCSCRKSEQRAHHNSIYYWRTTLTASPDELHFMKTHNVDKLYLRFFDVCREAENVVPNATLEFEDTTLLGCVDEIVPVCYITIEALRDISGMEREYASKITNRMINMCSYHNLSDKVHEIQIDCDWTESTQEAYFYLLKHIRSLLNEKAIQLSATIRLHQLRLDAPPIDRGVLMIYNTGNLLNPETRNSILDYNDAARYLKHSAVKKYDIALDYAFPTFSWGVAYRQGHYIGLASNSYSPLDFNDHKGFKRIDSTHVKVINTYRPNVPYFCEIGDIIREETSEYKTIMSVKQLLPLSKNNSVILYHLDANNLKTFSDNEIENIFSTTSL